MYIFFAQKHPKDKRYEKKIAKEKGLESEMYVLVWESREKEPFGCKCDGELQRILYGGRWWLPSSSGRGESSESKVARGLS